ncbi:MAG: succinate dehydrogenase cytochrome b subunit [Crocinitomicaceae bacterium]|nr:succinate dehydrogenase cytochrome b subunit [Crocinitomicaceae bacterium]
MSKSVLLKSSLAKKYWMALTGLFLCTFLVGHLLGNLQLLAGGEEGRLAFNQYAHFMSHNIFIKIMSYLTYISILFHVIDGFLLVSQNRKARPVKYAYSKPNANSSWTGRSMAVLGTLILVFIVMHMSHFWWKAKYSSTPMPLHRVEVGMPGDAQTQTLYVTTNGSFMPTEGVEIKNGTEFYAPDVNLKVGEGYKDLHSLTVSFFGHDKTKEGFPANQNALLAVIFYTLAMLVLSFHLWHGFASAFQSLGARHPKYTPLIQSVGKAFSVLVPLAFAIIPIYIYLMK